MLLVRKILIGRRCISIFDLFLASFSVSYFQVRLCIFLSRRNGLAFLTFHGLAITNLACQVASQIVK
ncbi:hypothetical protein HMPREF1557_00577 [Streptococcus sobrinus W1703]|uniref:Uncharacterized protein n=1 Tax=Streptococcus sobrinus W1703 TaxID=1227275 RepID=U2JDB3_9STRE|nr:hypothetical protein HMPREF1557_00577 [Streptococcus sobrinus W1703]